MSMTNGQAEIEAEPVMERPEMKSFYEPENWDPEPENWLSRGIGIFLGLAISAAAVGGVVGLLHLGGRL